jgi:hypothetical protein
MGKFPVWHHGTEIALRLGMVAKNDIQLVQLDGMQQCMEQQQIQQRTPAYQSQRTGMKLLAGACASKEAKKKESYRLNKVPLG